MYAPSGSAAIAGPVEERHDLQILPCQMGAAFNRGKVHEEANSRGVPLTVLQH